MWENVYPPERHHLPSGDLPITLPSQQLPDFGVLNILDLHKFLEEAKQTVPQRYSLKGSIHHYNLKDFEKQQILGGGSFGLVILVREKNSDQKFAVKMVEKRQMVQKKIVDQVLSEKRVLQMMNFPFVVRLVEFLTDNSYLYFVMPYVSRGDLFVLLRNVHMCDESLSRFYISQIILALEYLHYLDLIYRDLKPENILIDHTGYLKLTDFGLCKMVQSRTWTLCGTPEYLAPEIILNKGYGKSVDWWALGVLMFELSAGRTPFQAKNHLDMYAKITTKSFVFPSNFKADLKDIITHLLQIDLSLRYGNLKHGVDDIKNHVWFRPIDWCTVLNRKMLPPYMPHHPPLNIKIDIRKIEFKVSQVNKYEKEFMDF